MSKQHVFIVRQQYLIREADVEIFIGPKFTWALLSDGKRKLLGCTVFFTRASAERAKLGHLRKMVATGALRFLVPNVWHSANRQLEEYTKTGVLH